MPCTAGQFCVQHHSDLPPGDQHDVADNTWTLTKSKHVLMKEEAEEVAMTQAIGKRPAVCGMFKSRGLHSTIMTNCRPASHPLIMPDPQRRRKVLKYVI